MSILTEFLIKYENGFVTMIMGMGVVFSFLTVLVFAMQIMSKVIEYLNKVFPEVKPAVNTVKQKSTDDIQIALAIAAAYKMKFGK